MTSTTRFWLGIGLLITIVLITSGSYLIMHENMHKTIYADFGVDSEIRYNFLFMSGETTATLSSRNLTDEQINTIRVLQMQTEIIQYPLGFIATLLSLIVGILAVQVFLGDD